MIDAVAIVSGGMDSVTPLHRKNAIRVETPFIHLSKADILRVGFELGVDYAQTWSCYEGERLARGVCTTCAERLQVFAEIGQRDPLPYRPSAGSAS